MLLPLALVASFVPSILVFLYLSGNHGDDQQYRVNCRKCLIGGILCSGGVVLLSAVSNISLALLGLNNAPVVIQEAASAFIIAALSEELMKMWQTRKAIERGGESTSALDVISYACITGLGFGLLEAVVYMFSSNAGQIMLRGIAMSHGVYGLIMGFILAKGIAKKSRALQVLALAVPLLIHGTYDFDLGMNERLGDSFGYVALALTVICMGIMVYAMFFYVRKARKNADSMAPLEADGHFKLV